MAVACVRDSFIGECLRLITRPSWLKYEEEHPGWQGKPQGEKTIDDNQTILVDWYSEDDAENPHNWSQAKKAFVLFVIGMYSFVVYMAAPIYTPSVDAFVDEFGVNNAEGSLGLAIYVYGELGFKSQNENLYI